VKGEITYHSRGATPVITWGAARVKGRGVVRVSGVLAELLEGPTVTQYSLRDSSLIRGDHRREREPTIAKDGTWSLTDLELKEQDRRLELERLGVAFPDFEEMDLLMAWSAIDQPVRRAWYVLLVLADRRCRSRTPGSSRFNTPTSHLLRGGGFYPGDVAWMAGLRTSEHHRLRRVLENLERFGVLKKLPKVRGRTTRYTINARPRATALTELLTEDSRQELLRISRLIRECVPSPRSKTGRADEWAPLRRVNVPGGEAFVVGTTSSSRRAFLERELPPLCRKLAEFYRPPARRLRPPKWWLDADAREAHFGSVLIIPL
jgi:hypothetical protein